MDQLETLEFDDVFFQHASASTPALAGIAFRATRGETIAFVGPSGSGKTTLVKLLVGLYRPKSGHVYYNGIDESTVDMDALREKIGFVTQKAQLFSGTIRENLQFVRAGATDAECLEVLHRAAVDGLLARADRGLDTLIGEAGVKVSGGERQRLSIARALLRQPQLLVFDEATSSLDSLTEEEISQTIRDVAHQVETVERLKLLTLLTWADISAVNPTAMTPWRASSGPGSGMPSAISNSFSAAGTRGQSRTYSAFTDATETQNHRRPPMLRTGQSAGKASSLYC